MIENPPFEKLSKAQMHAALAPTVDSILTPIGFECTKELFWVRSERAPIREFFSLHQGRSSLQPLWGFSLDFVPSISGGKIKWHRTAKAAKPDLMGPICYSMFGAKDSTIYKQLQMTSIWGLPALMKGTYMSSCLHNGAEVALPSALEFAMRDWEKVRNPNDIMVIFDEIKAVGPAFHMMPHYALTYSICLARVGRLAEGQDQLEKFLSMSVDLDKNKISDQVRGIFNEAYSSFEG